MKRNGQALLHGRFVFVIVSILFLSSLFISGCKKDVTPTAEEEIATAASVGKMKNVDLQMIADGFVSPIGVVPIPDNTGRLIVIDQIGKLWVLDANGNKLPAALAIATTTEVSAWSILFWTSFVDRN